MPAPFRGCGNEGDVTGCRRSYARSLVGSEEEQLILQDWAADAGAELIPFERVLCGAKKFRALRLTVTEKFEDGLRASDWFRSG